MFTPPRNDRVKCLANFTLSSCKSAKTAEASANLPFTGIIRGRFAKLLCEIFGVTYRK